MFITADQLCLILQVNFLQVNFQVSFFLSAGSRDARSSELRFAERVEGVERSIGEEENGSKVRLSARVSRWSRAESRCGTRGRINGSSEAPRSNRIYRLRAKRTIITRAFSRKRARRLGRMRYVFARRLIFSLESPRPADTPVNSFFIFRRQFAREPRCVHASADISRRARFARNAAASLPLPGDPVAAPGAKCTHVAARGEEEEGRARTLAHPRS